MNGVERIYGHTYPGGGFLLGDSLLYGILWKCEPFLEAPSHLR